MRIKTTALLLSAILPLSVWAMPEQGQQKQQNMQSQQGMQGQQGMQKQSAEQKQKNTKWRQDKMQKRQAAWFERLELTPVQREAFQAEMQEHRAQQQKARTAHHDKLRALLNDEQRVTFDQEMEQMQERMQNYMQKSDKSSRSGQDKRAQRANTAQ
ncbi:hypothetical protein [Denitrificimonas caeni]|uniref:hypothetical protein n=1 Tax=Denitrificimonas caeni TaxID=521720 RepID=UPI001966AF8A|nr:hypothetical protein [Denitrificimonas caeni]